MSNPFTDPQLVAATRSIPYGFPYDLAVSADGNYLYATFTGIPVEGPKPGDEGAVMVYDINQIIDTLGTADPQTLKVLGIDAINPAIDVDANYQLPLGSDGLPLPYNPNQIDSYAPPFVSVNPAPGDEPPIATGGIPHGLAVQSNTPVDTVDPTAGGFIQVNLAQDALSKFKVQGITNYYMDIQATTGDAQIALKQNIANYTLQGLTPNQALDQAKESDILSVLPTLPGGSGQLHQTAAGLFGRTIDFVKGTPNDTPDLEHRPRR